MTPLLGAFGKRRAQAARGLGSSKICLSFRKMAWLRSLVCLPGRQRLPYPGGSTVGPERAGGSGALLQRRKCCPRLGGGAALPVPGTLGLGHFPGVATGHHFPSQREGVGGWAPRETLALLGACWRVGSVAFRHGVRSGSWALLPDPPETQGLGGRARGVSPADQSLKGSRRLRPSG